MIAATPANDQRMGAMIREEVSRLFTVEE
ncbi:MAG: hypothetical protein QOF40_801, partial [Actinomycetota bacterium]|nr:hypothetical protein [Actinomycetota bacterium]